ncbi:MAG: ATP synthase F1 subunit gamma [Candidatus Omnitrophica bacterium]|nr:ATP synthase F1 subunit gamma [Candidatus Omnitrophota bacterium]
MIQSLRQIKSRIKSIQNTHKLTRAMEMISLTKMRSFQKVLPVYKKFFSKLEGMIYDLSASFETAPHPFLRHPDKCKKAVLCIITSDTGLCGAYNHNILGKAEDFLQKSNCLKTDLITIGKKGFIYFKKKGYNVPEVYTDLHGRYSEALADKISARLIDLFISGECDEVYVAYTLFESASRHKPVVERFLNIEKKLGTKREYIIEPEADAMLAELLPVYMRNKMRIILLNSFACEHSARAMAMGEATENAKEVLGNLTLFRNKVRQANITKEIIEVISSADALKG